MEANVKERFFLVKFSKFLYKQMKKLSLTIREERKRK